MGDEGRDIEDVGFVVTPFVAKATSCSGLVQQPSQQKARLNSNSLPSIVWC